MSLSKIIGEAISLGDNVLQDAVVLGIFILIDIAFPIFADTIKRVTGFNDAVNIFPNVYLLFKLIAFKKGTNN